jgi:hypothetical protein
MFKPVVFALVSTSSETYLPSLTITANVFAIFAVHVLYKIITQVITHKLGIHKYQKK